MTVKDLMSLLAKADPEAEVILSVEDGCVEGDIEGVDLCSDGTVHIRDHRFCSRDKRSERTWEQVSA